MGSWDARSPHLNAQSPGSSTFKRMFSLKFSPCFRSLDLSIVVARKSVLGCVHYGLIAGELLP